MSSDIAHLNILEAALQKMEAEIHRAADDAPHFIKEYVDPKWLTGISIHEIRRFDYPYEIDFMSGFIWMWKGFKPKVDA